MINIALLVQSSLYSELLEEKLNSEKDFSIISRSTTEDELILNYSECDIDIIIVDSFLPKLNLSSFIDNIENINSDTGLIVLFHFNDIEMMIKAITSGIEGCLNIDSGYSDLVQAIRTVKDGGIWADNVVLTTALKRFINKHEKPLKHLTNSLTKREIEISELINHGFSNKAIANKLYISEKTVKTHISHIFKKLGIKHRYQLNPNFLENILKFNNY